MSIANIILASKDTEFTFPGHDNFKVTLRYNTAERLNQLRKGCLKTSMDPNTGQPREELDFEAWNNIFATHTIIGWSGFTYEILAQLILIDETKVNMEEEIEHTNENAAAMLNSSRVFDSWVSGCLKDISNFRN